jgi:ABC-type lipoprotein release transport system permease subunit
MLIKIAWRNIWRHKSRSTIIIASVAFGLWAGLFMQGYMNGRIEERILSAIQNEISHLQIHHPDFKTNYDVNNYIPDGEKAVSEIAGMENVKFVTGRIVAQGMVASTTGSSGVQINGIDISVEDSITNKSKSITEGNWLSNKNEVVVGKKLANKLKLKTGNKIILTLVDKDKNLTSGAFRIKGIYETNNAPSDEKNLFIRKQDLSLLTATPNEVNEIAILLNNNDSLSLIQQKLKQKYPSTSIESWEEIAPELSLIVSTGNQSMVIFMVIILLALAFGIINTMLMAVLERTREIGMLMALGMNKARIFVMIMLETNFLIFTGTPLGILLGYLTVYYFGKYGIDLSMYKEVALSFGFSHIIYPKLNFSDLIILFELVVITSIISSLLPARKALSLNPSEAIRK